VLLSQSLPVQLRYDMANTKATGGGSVVRPSVTPMQLAIGGASVSRGGEKGAADQQRAAQRWDASRRHRQGHSGGASTIGNRKQPLPASKLVPLRVALNRLTRALETAHVSTAATTYEDDALERTLARGHQVGWPEMSRGTTTKSGLWAYGTMRKRLAK
jgi:hypothetical protein